MALRLDYTRLAAPCMQGLDAVHALIGRSGLPRTLLNLVYLRVSQINGCAYCLDLHTRDLRAAGETVHRLTLVAVWDETDALFTTTERAALRWAETVTRLGDHPVPDAAFSAAAAAFNEPDLAHLTIAIGLMNAYNRIAISLRAVPQASRIS